MESGCPKEDHGKGLTSHQSPHTNEKPDKSPLEPHKCPFEGCTSAYHSPGHLAAHIRFHSKKSLDRCSWKGCRQIVTSSSNLLRYCQKHSDRKTFGCPKCPKKFVYQSSIYKHLQRAHKEENKTYKECSIYRNIKTK